MKGKKKSLITTKSLTKFPLSSYFSTLPSLKLSTDFLSCSMFILKILLNLCNQHTKFSSINLSLSLPKIKFLGPSTNGMLISTLTSPQKRPSPTVHFPFSFSIPTMSFSSKGDPKTKRLSLCVGRILVVHIQT